jgi:hypothetical protein
MSLTTLEVKTLDLNQAAALLPVLNDVRRGVMVTTSGAGGDHGG